MKIFNKLSDFKTRIFFIVSIAMLSGFVGILIYEAVVKIFNAPLFIFGEILLITGVVLILTDEILRNIKQRAVARAISGIIFAVCFIGLQTAFAAMFPRYYAITTEYIAQFDELKDIPPENKDEFWEKYDALQEITDAKSQLSLTLGFLNLGSWAAVILARCCAMNLKKEKSADDKDHSEIIQ